MLQLDTNDGNKFFPEVIESHNILLEVIEVAIHNILFLRKLYPEGVFKLMKKFEVPVHISQHPEINAYICECLKAIKTLMEKKKLKQVSVVILDKGSVPIEKFVFRIQLQHFGGSSRRDAAMSKAYSALRALILRMSVTDAHLKKLPEMCSFLIQVHTTENAMMEFQQSEVHQNFPWIEAESREVVLLNPNILPIKNIDESGIQLEVFVEESVNS